MVAPAAVAKVTPEGYLAMERVAQRKHEFWRGDVFAMAGASLRHNLVVGNLVRELGTKLRERPCVVFPSDIKVHVPAKPGFVYPDVSVLCGPIERFDDAADVVTNPMLVIEVLSKSTEAFDRGEKFDGYSSIASVRDIVLVAQVERKIEVFTRQPDGAWLLRIVREGGTAALPSLGLSLDLDEVYSKAFDVPSDVDAS